MAAVKGSTTENYGRTCEFYFCSIPAVKATSFDVMVVPIDQEPILQSVEICCRDLSPETAFYQCFIQLGSSCLHASHLTHRR